MIIRMGAYVAKEEDESLEIATPHFEKYGNLVSSTSDDPRSPAIDDVKRTPLVFRDQIEDPRSPPSGYERTPVFSIPEPGTPKMRFKMDNLGFEDSPLSSVTEKLSAIRISEKQNDTSEDISNENLTPEMDAQYLEDDIPKGIDEIESPISSKTNSELSPLIKDKNVKKLRNRKSNASNKNKNALLKQALFKPYVDNESSEMKSSIKYDTVNKQRRPLSNKSINLVLNNPNVDDASTDIKKDKLQPFSFEKAIDKENMPVL
eukprot:TCONS_00025869-protein